VLVNLACVNRSFGPAPNGLPAIFSNSFAMCSSVGWFSGEKIANFHPIS
jgi:hypothetical protein